MARLLDNLAGPIEICPICYPTAIRRAMIGGRCYVCQSAVKRMLGRGKDRRQIQPAPVAPLVVYPVQPLAEINRRLAEWVAAQPIENTMEAA